MRLPALFCLMLTPAPALAAGAVQVSASTTFSYGYINGLAHPLPGFEHLVIVLIIGAAAALSGRSVQGILAWLTGMMIALPAIFAVSVWPVQEILGAGALLLTGAMIASGRRISALRLATVFFAAGVAQAAIFSGPVLAPLADPTPAGMAGYVLGFAGTQLLIAAAAALLATTVRPLPVRLAGVAVVSAGLLLCFQMAETALAGSSF